jgi:hypothetical protein
VASSFSEIYSLNTSRNDGPADLINHKYYTGDLSPKKAVILAGPGLHRYRRENWQASWTARNRALVSVKQALLGPTVQLARQDIGCVDITVKWKQ